MSERHVFWHNLLLAAQIAAPVAAAAVLVLLASAIPGWYGVLAILLAAPFLLALVATVWGVRL